MRPPRGAGDDRGGAHPSPPADFRPVADDVTQRAGHLIPVPAATTWPVADVWSVAVPARSELQAFLDEHLGAASLEITAALYERTITHEAFHAYQMTVLGGPGGLPDFGADGDEPVRLDDLEHSDGIDAALREQGRLLAAAFLDARRACGPTTPGRAC